MQVSYAAESHVGLRRTSNEDVWLADERLKLFVVCDGMGGHEAGEVASRTAAAAVARHLRRALGPRGGARDSSRVSEALREAVHEAHRDVSTESQRLCQVRHMGTTLVAAVLIDGVAVVASVGDSRAYLLGGERTRRLTSDHTLAEQYAELGLIPPDSVPKHPLRHVLVRAIGGCGDTASPDVVLVPLEVGDRLLLCTDGLSEMLDEDEIVRIASSTACAREAVEELTRAALAEGGLDNVTTLVVEREAERPVPTRRPRELARAGSIPRA